MRHRFSHVHANLLCTYPLNAPAECFKIHIFCDALSKYRFTHHWLQSVHIRFSYYLLSIFDVKIFCIALYYSFFLFMKQYVRCTKVDHESRVKQTFYDVPLQVRNNANSK